jgi:hypothetical protein
MTMLSKYEDIENNGLQHMRVNTMEWQAKCYEKHPNRPKQLLQI